MDAILGDEFFEFGRSGRIYERSDTLGIPAQDIDITLPLKNFQAHPVADDVVLVTYVSEVQYDELEVASRSSLWVKTEGGWRLRFHQGTPVQH